MDVPKSRQCHSDTKGSAIGANLQTIPNFSERLGYPSEIEQWVL